MHRAAFAAALAAVVALPAPAATAQRIEAGLPRAGAPSWRDSTDPARRRARHLRRQGLVILLDGVASDDNADVYFDRALIRFDRARQALTADPDLLYFTALALALWRRDSAGEEERRVDEAIAAFEELRRVDPDYHADRIAVELALLHARRSDHAAAAAEYRRALAAAMPSVAPLHYELTDRELALARLWEPVSISTVHLNLAESLMLLGDLEGSVAHYRHAVERAEDSVLTRVLALWGLAVALDRSDEHSDAIATARRAIQADPASLYMDDPTLGMDRTAHGPMAILHSRLVFFEPAYEVFAYDAIGREALARGTTDPQARDDQLRRAVIAWRAFLAGGGNAGRYAEHARRSLERLERELGGRAAPAPDPADHGASQQHRGSPR